MYVDPQTALESLVEEALLPNPVKVRDMLLHARLNPEESLELNRLFIEYQQQFGVLQKLGKRLLQEIAARPVRA
ncbi:MAG TPA: hypothetical protein VFP40_15485 [Terriglobales bacterium]|nr:hypothetical protein [Terriglobales bacterium]